MSLVVFYQFVSHLYYQLQLMSNKYKWSCEPDQQNGGGFIVKQSKTSITKPGDFKTSVEEQVKQPNNRRIQQPRRREKIKALDCPDEENPQYAPIIQGSRQHPKIYYREKEAFAVEKAKKFIQKCEESRPAKVQYTLNHHNHSYQKDKPRPQSQKQQKSSLGQAVLPSRKMKKEASYPCAFCDKQMTLQQIDDHHKVCEMAFKCNLCQDFFSIALITEHLKYCKASKTKQTQMRRFLNVRQQQPIKQERKRPMIEAFKAKEESRTFKRYEYENNYSQEDEQYERMQLQELGLSNLDLGQHHHPNHVDLEDNIQDSEDQYEQEYYREPQRSHNTKGLTEREIRRLKTDTYQKRETQSQAQCGICTKEMQQGDQIIILPCCHTYHTDCILPWLQMKSICPTCKHTLK